MSSAIVKLIARHAIHYASGLTCDASILGSMPQALSLYNSLLYQTWWELLQREVEKNPDIGDFTYQRALEMGQDYICDLLPEANGHATDFRKGQILLEDLHRLEVGNG